MGIVLGPAPLAQYVDDLASVPMPTDEQKENFAEYVSHSHSWYKHISLYPPGSPFHFFVYRHAGRERKHGTTQLSDRLTRGFHYNQIPTDLYRSSFGHLAWSHGSRNDVRVVVNDTLFWLPTEIFEAGFTRLTAVMHAQSASGYMRWQWDKSRRPDHVDWPAESGGLATLERIDDRCRRIQELGSEYEPAGNSRWPLKPFPHSDEHEGFVDQELYEILAPERKRLRGLIVQAIDRVCEVIGTGVR